jgi:hypothetical protein
MASATFRKSLAEHGRRFDQHEHEKRGEGQVIVTVHRGGRRRPVVCNTGHAAVRYLFAMLRKRNDGKPAHGLFEEGLP